MDFVSIKIVYLNLDILPFSQSAVAVKENIAQPSNIINSKKVNCKDRKPERFLIVSLGPARIFLPQPLF